jgi:hypothetical protein
MEGTPLPVFCEKRLQAIENKGMALKKERQETSRGGNRMEDKDLGCLGSEGKSI